MFTHFLLWARNLLSCHGRLLCIRIVFSNFCLWLFLIGGAPFLIAQSPTPIYELVPSEFDDDDLISLEISYGSEASPITDLLEVEFVFACEGFTVDFNSSLQLDLSNSWFAPDNNWAGTVSRNSSGDTLTVSLDRTDNEPVEGHGEIAVVPGILVDIEDIIGKRSNEAGIKLVSATPFIILKPVLKILSNPGEPKILVIPQSDSEMVEVSVNSLSGKAVYYRKGIIISELLIDLSHLPTGMYVLRFNNGSRLHQEKVFIER